MEIAAAELQLDRAHAAVRRAERAYQEAARAVDAAHEAASALSRARAKAREDLEHARLDEQVAVRAWVEARYPSGPDRARAADTVVQVPRERPEPYVD